MPSGAPLTSATSSEVTTTSIQSVLGPYGDPGGLRAFLKTRGIEYDFTYVGETLANPTGGIRQGAIYEGRLDGEVNIDLAKLAGLNGAQAHANFYQIHGRGLSTYRLGDLFTASGIEAFPDTKLYEAWLQQSVFNDKLALRVGQLAVDAEYLVSETASVFVNSSFGFPAIYSNDLPSGGGSYPFAAPGVELRCQPTKALTFSSVVYDGDPAGIDDPALINVSLSKRDPGGVAFRLRDKPFFLNEITYLYGQDGTGLPGLVKLGYFHHFGQFADFMAAPGTTRSVRGDDGAYLLVDQTIYKEPNSTRGASVFLRVAGAPPGRNLFDAFIDGGIAFRGLLPDRGRDTIGLAGTYAHVSSDVSRLDSLAAKPLVRDYQALIEATYQYVAFDGFTLQPDFQYIFHPGAGGVADPNGRPVHDAAVLGLRATVVY